MYESRFRVKIEIAQMQLCVDKLDELNKWRLRNDSHFIFCFVNQSEEMIIFGEQQVFIIFRSAQQSAEYRKIIVDFIDLV